MDVGRELRQARQASGLGQRALAAASGISERTVSRLEAGTTTTTVPVLERLLAAAGRELVTAPSAESADVDEAALRDHLELSLHARLRRSISRLLGSASEVDGLLEALSNLARGGPLALGHPWDAAIWVPDVDVRLPLVLRQLDDRPLPAVTSTHVVLPPLRHGTAGLVAVAIDPVRTLRVGTPASLADDVCLAPWAGALRTAARLLDTHGGRDGAGRHAPAGRQPYEIEEACRLVNSLRYLGEPRPTALDSRAWRLGTPVSLPQWLAERGAPPLLGQRRTAARRARGRSGPPGTAE